MKMHVSIMALTVAVLQLCWSGCGDDDNPCVKGQYVCDNKCVDFETDDDNCGKCDNICGYQSDCEAGVCVCNEGFHGDGFDCTDIDECTAGTNNCDANAACTNTSGSFSCECNTGYSGDGVNCTDIDECTEGTHNCDDNAACTNNPGGFSCECSAGFSGDGISCTDIDECSEGTNNCDVEASCTNTPGSFSCECSAGYVGDGAICALPADFIDAGNLHTCVVLESGHVKCWGSNMYGQLGLGDRFSRGLAPDQMGDSLPIVDLGTGHSAVSVALGSLHTCALLDTGQVKCWGMNRYGQLGLGDTFDRGDVLAELGDNMPTVDLGTGRTALAISAGDSHTCALLDTGQVKCWGLNSSGELGLGDTNNRGDEPGEMGDSLPFVELGAGLTAVDLSSGNSHNCVILDTGQVKCWGENLFGELGLGDRNQRGDEPDEMGNNLPCVDLGTGHTVLNVTAGRASTCATLDTRQVKCWGINLDGELGLEDTNVRGDEPGEMGNMLPVVDLGTGLTASELASGYARFCALLDTGQIKCWGWNYKGELGLGDTNVRGDDPGEMGDDLPSVDLGTGLTAVGGGGGVEHTCALLNDGQVKCWGGNNNGQLGQGDRINRGDEPGEMGDNLPPVDL